jgi:sterol 24-C-methyltransferase
MAVRALNNELSEFTQRVAQYYTHVPDFYERGWGPSFHFAPRFEDETFRESLRRHEYYLALRMGLSPDMHVLDVGCGIGGPMRNIVRFSGAEVTGITITPEQVARAEAYNREAGLEDRCHLICGDWKEIPREDSTFDGAFAVEATMHEPDRRRVFSEVRRVLRPGALFAGYEWCLTDRYDPDDPEHERLRTMLDSKIAVKVVPTREVDEALAASGFEVLEGRDTAGEGSPDRPWYRPLTRYEGGFRGFRSLPVGRIATRYLVSAMEAVRLAPRGSRGIQAMLVEGADVLVRSGELGIFTPNYFFLARKSATAA